MKKIIVLILVLIVCAACFCACTIGNRQIGIDMTHTFQWGIIQLGNGELIEGEVTAWRDFNESDVVQLTINNITYLTHYSNVILATERP